VAETVGAHAKAGRFPLTLGGDHSLAMGTISGTLESVRRIQFCMA
jgi:arginase